MGVVKRLFDCLAPPVGPPGAAQAGAPPPGAVGVPPGAIALIPPQPPHQPPELPSKLVFLKFLGLLGTSLPGGGGQWRAKGGGWV